MQKDEMEVRRVQMLWDLAGHVEGVEFLLTATGS